MQSTVTFSPAILEAMKEMTSPQLRELKAIVGKEIDVRHRNDIEVARAEINQIVKVLGEPLAVIMRDGASAPKLKTKAEPKDPLPVMYRHPETKAGWSGRGRAPAWFKEWDASGKDKAELRV